METLKEKFRRKIKICYAKQVKEWMQSDPKKLIDNASRIAITKQIAEILSDVTTDIEMDYLMQFKDPLKIVTDAWIVENEDSIDGHL
ncbi:MAG: hypothetical protein V3G42_16195 [Oscillospiraceae bacterium]